MNKESTLKEVDKLFKDLAEEKKRIKSKREEVRKIHVELVAKKIIIGSTSFDKKPDYDLYEEMLPYGKSPVIKAENVVMLGKPVEIPAYR